MRRNVWLKGLFILVLLFIVGCSNDEKGAEEQEGKLKVTSTTGMIGDVVANVGGEYVESISLMKPGIDPHLYKATQGDINKLGDADIIFYNGLNLEGKMEDIFVRMKKDKPIFPVTKAIADAELLESADYPGQFDPHVWFNVKHWISATEVVRDELVKLDKANTEAYEANAKAYIAELEELHEYVKEQLQSIPEQDRVLVTAHDAFGYFGDAYGIEVRGLQGISTNSEIGSKDVSELRNYLVENKIKAVFVESSVPKTTIEAVIDGALEQGHTVEIGGELFSDAMGAEGTAEGTYIGMVRHNVKTITEALK
ncbi:MAG: metal ABC transporter solute-binding protein, Zn/Mn family [Bacillus sp. (in: firmicutes)]